MSLAELTDATLPHLTGRLALRRHRTISWRVLKSIRRHQKTLMRRIVAWQRSQYYLATAGRDLHAAAARNEDIVLGTAVVALAVIFAVASLASQLVLQSFLTMSYLNDVTGFSVLPLVVIFAGVLATLAGWITAWLCNALSIGIMDSLTRRRDKSLRATLRRGLRSAARTATSWLTLVVLMFAPIMALGLGSLLVAHLIAGHNLFAYFYALALTACSGTLWLLYTSTTFGLSPQVALYMPDLELRDVFMQSRQLVLRRGRPFILALHLSAVAFLGAAYGLTMLLQKVFGSTVDILFYSAVPLCAIVLNLMLTVLYRKRRLARTN